MNAAPEEDEGQGTLTAGFTPVGHIDAVEIILRATVNVLATRLGKDFAEQVRDAILQEADNMAASPYPDEQYDAEVIRAVANGRLFRDLGV